MSESVALAELRSMKRALEMFRPDGPSSSGSTECAEEGRPAWQRLRLASKIRSEFASVAAAQKQQQQQPAAKSAASSLPTTDDSLAREAAAAEMRDAQKAAGVLLPASSATASASLSMALVPQQQQQQQQQLTVQRRKVWGGDAANKPEWHAPWKLYRVIAGHLGWVRSVAVDPTNDWFATGSADRTIKVWDVASGALRLTLTGHISTVRGLAVSQRAPYLFSCGEDKMVKCWDLETNQVIRHYHGHLSGVYCLALHPTLDVLVTGGRDSVARVWDIRTQANVHVLEGHTNTVMSLATQAVDPQVVTGSMDNNVRLWDLAAGKSVATLTHHKKGIRGIAIHPTEFAMVTGAADNIKKWRFPNGDFLCNFSGHRAIVNAIALNQDNVVVSGGDNGSMHFWDWRTGYCFQQEQIRPQPGSLESEAGVYALAFDQTGTRLITCEADKSIKMWKPDEDATPETHPVVNWRQQQQRY